MSSLFVLIQYLLPHHLLSRFVGFFAEGSFLKNVLIRSFVRRYKVDMSEAAISDPLEYPSFNTFFTRELKADARPIDSDEAAIVCPADGAVSALGLINDEQILQAKGRDYSISDLLGGDQQLANEFRNGAFATIYLSPRDYHRVHMPLAGRLQKLIYVPGRLFSVNQATANAVPNLFARNERAICVFSTEAGPMCVVLVGAMIVAGIETIWSGQVCPSIGSRSIRQTEYSDNEPPIQLATGAELGRFKLGSTAIVLFAPEAITLNQDLDAESPVKMGQRLATLVKQS
mgnify:CR=1 FL=1|jgi:phosphatidylserine decarboxylase